MLAIEIHFHNISKCPINTCQSFKVAPLYVTRHHEVGSTPMINYWQRKHHGSSVRPAR